MSPDNIIYIRNMIIIFILYFQTTFDINSTHFSFECDWISMVLAFIAVLNFMVKFSAITNMTSGLDIYDPKEFYSQCNEANAQAL